MQNIEQITELVENAASLIIMIDPEDLSEIDNLNKILDEIKKSLSELDYPEEILEKTIGQTSESIKLLEKMLHNEIESTDKSMQVVSNCITSIQECISNVDRGDINNLTDSQGSPDEHIDELPQESEGIVISPDDVPLVQDFIAESLEHIESAESGLLELEEKPNDKDIINLIFRGFHTIKGMAGFLNLTDIGSLAHAAENLLGFAREDKLSLSGEVTDIIFQSIDMMKKMIEILKKSVESGQPVLIQKNLPQFLEKLDSFVEKEPQESKEKACETAEDTPVKTLDSNKDKIIEDNLEKESSTETTKTSQKKETVSNDEKIKVSTTRLDNLINMVGELVIAQLMVSEEVSKTISADNQLGYKVSNQSKLVRELQELSMSMRMVPISGVFQKMARLVRDLSHKSGKNINFTTSGDDTELDRSIVDKIADPLIHMVRNSIDHGIEDKEERNKAGKNPKGKLELRAFHRAGNIVIEIEDDGKGLNKELILKKAITNGIVDANQELPDEDIYKLIFHAGLSTAQKVTSISGRGVGMDVVKKNIESLNGKIDIHSVPGKGTIFTISMPLTLAIIDGQIIKVGQEKYIIPINSIINSFRPKESQISTIQNNGEVVLVRGELIPLVRLYKVFGVIPNSEIPSESLLVIVEKDSHKYCLLVDELMDQQQVVIKSLNEGLGKIKGISGASIMGDGKVSLILDIPGLIELANS